MRGGNPGEGGSMVTGRDGRGLLLGCGGVAGCMHLRNGAKQNARLEGPKSDRSDDGGATGMKARWILRI